MGYALMVAATVAAYLLIRRFGSTILAPPGIALIGTPKAFSEVGFHDLQHALLAIIVVIGAAQAVGFLFHLINQPPVLGEIAAGIALGPSLLGHFAPEISALLLPTSIQPFLKIFSQIGIILYMFLVGLEVDLGVVRKRARSCVAVSHASIAVPFLLGSSLALLLYPALSTSDIGFTSFSLFLGVSMSVTAFPVLARIIAERRLKDSELGTIALTCAGVDDVTAWCLLAFVVSIVQSRLNGAVAMLAMSAAYIAVMLYVVRPIAIRLLRVNGSKDHLARGAMAAVLLTVLLSSLTTELIGIHALFGAFALGMVMPQNNAVAKALTRKLEDIVAVLLLPAFFVFTGLRTQIGLVSGAKQWLICGLIILIASAGKFGGSCLAARFTGLDWRNAAALGVLMNTRGLMELIVLNIGLDLGVISPTLFAMLVLMALVTTFATTPLLDVILNRRTLQARRAHA